MSMATGEYNSVSSRARHRTGRHRTRDPRAAHRARARARRAHCHLPASRPGPAARTRGRGPAPPRGPTRRAPPRRARDRRGRSGPPAAGRGGLGQRLRRGRRDPDARRGRRTVAARDPGAVVIVSLVALALLGVLGAASRWRPAAPRRRAGARRQRLGHGPDRGRRRPRRHGRLTLARPRHGRGRPGERVSGLDGRGGVLGVAAHDQALGDAPHRSRSRSTASTPITDHLGDDVGVGHAAARRSCGARARRGSPRSRPPSRPRAACATS